MKEYKVTTFDIDDIVESVDYFDNKQSAYDFAELQACYHSRVTVCLLNMFGDYVPCIDYINGCRTEY